MITLELTLDLPSGSEARAVLDALDPDNAGYVDSELQGDKLVFRMGSDSAGTLRNTADDLMACIKTAEEAVGIGRSS